MRFLDSFRRWRDARRARDLPATPPAAAAQGHVAQGRTSQAPPAMVERIEDVLIDDPPHADGLLDARRPPQDTPHGTPRAGGAEDAAAASEALADDGYQGPERREKPRINVRPGTRVLIVDDSATVVMVLRRMLQQNGFQTYEAYTAEEALELARDLVPDLIFLDIVLPEMDGFAALRTLRREPATKQVPVIMISGNVQATEQFYVQRIGADDFMKKPFSRAEVFARIDRLLDADGVPRRASMVGTELPQPPASP